MKTAIVVSKKDLAGMNILDSLKNTNLKELNAELFKVENDSIHCENIDKEIDFKNGD